MSVTYVSQPPQFDIGEIFHYIVLQIYYKAPWCSGLTCHPVTVEIRGSNPLGVAHSNFLLTLGLYPVFVLLPLKTKHKLPSSLWLELAEQHKTESLRQLANKYGVSYEAVRRTIARAKSTTLDRKLFKD